MPAAAAIAVTRAPLRHTPGRDTATATRRHETLLHILRYIGIRATLRQKAGNIRRYCRHVDERVELRYATKSATCYVGDKALI